MLEEATFIAFLFNIYCRHKRWSFLVSKCSLCVSLVDMSCKCDWCSPSVSFWCLSDCVVSCHVDMCGVSLLSYSGASMFVWSVRHDC